MAMDKISKKIRERIKEYMAVSQPPLKEPDNLTIQMAQFDVFFEDITDNAWAYAIACTEWISKKYKSKEIWLIGHLAYDFSPSPLRANVILVADKIQPAEYLAAVTQLTKTLPYGFSLDLIRLEDAGDDVKHDIKEFGYCYDKRHKEFYQPERDDDNAPVNVGRALLIKYETKQDKGMLEKWGDMAQMMRWFIKPGEEDKYRKIGFIIDNEAPQGFAISPPSNAFAVNVNFDKKKSKSEEEDNKWMEAKPIDFPNRQSKEYFEEATANMNKGNFEDAVKSYTKSIELAPRIPETYCNRGAAKASLGSFKSAANDYTKAIELRPNFAPFYINRSGVLEIMKDLKSALADITKAIQLGVNNASLYFRRATIEGRLGDNKSALKDCIKAIELEPNFVEAHNGVGVAKSGLGDQKGAIEAYNKAIGINPNFTEAYYGRAIARGEIGRVEKDNIYIKDAIRDFDRLINLRPDFADAYCRRGILRGMLFDDEGAMRDLEKAISLDPSLKKFAQPVINDIRKIASKYPEEPPSFTHVVKGDKIILKGKTYSCNNGNKTEILDDDSEHLIEMANDYAGECEHKKALGCLDEVVRRHPDKAGPYYNRGAVKLEMGDYKGAIKDCDKALQLDPNLGGVYCNRALAKFRLGYSKKEIMADYDKAVEVDPNLLMPYLSRAGFKFDGGDKEGALEDCNKAISIEQNLPNGYCLRGKMKSEMQDFKGAIEDFDKALQLDPYFEEAYYVRACAKAELDDIAGSMKDLDIAIELEPYYADAYYSRGHTKKLLNDCKGAVKDWERAIELDPTLKRELTPLIKEAKKYM